MKLGVGVQAGSLTATSVHGPQLLVQFDSVKVPVPGGKAVALLDLLAQTRTEYVPADAKLVEGEAALFPVPAVRIPIEEEGVRSTGLVHACVACAPALHL